MNRYKHVLAATIAALLPAAALAHTPGARIQVSAFQNHVAFGGAAGNLSGLALGIHGVSHRLGGIGVHARLGYAVGDGASLETLGARIVAYPHRGISPYMSLGAVDLSSLSGATSATTSYQVNTTTGAITPTTTITQLPPVGVVMGDVFAGLRGRYALNPRMSLVAHAALGDGVGGSVTGLAASAPGSSTLATSYGVGMRYRVTKAMDARLVYSRTSIPVRGSTFKSGGVSVGMSYLFH